jgi:hypothetical protein
MDINYNLIIFRPDFDASREKLRKLGDAEGTLTKEEFNKMKQELEAEYLATFKKTVAMHETFLCRLARCVLTILCPANILKEALLKSGRVSLKSIFAFEVHILILYRVSGHNGQVFDGNFDYCEFWKLEKVG